MSFFERYLEGFETERLKTRLLIPEDVVAWTKFLSNPSSVKYHSNPNNFSPREWAQFWIEKQFKRYESNNFGMHAILEKSSGKFVGQCGLLTQVVDDEKELEIGYSFFNEHTGKGYATEAAIMFKNFAFDNNISSSVISIIHKLNTPSQNVAIRNGMIREKETTFFNMPVYVYRVKGLQING